ncbi:hypothetical protein FRC08_014641, partial [Ceratobasidium sp. 394]
RVFYRTNVNDVQISFRDSFLVNNPFRRFDFYGSHVKHLDVYGSKDEMLKVTGWKLLISRARQQVLLPRLHTLTIRTSSDSSGPVQSMWVRAFSSPSLVNLLITSSDLSHPPTISFPAASFIMKSLVAHCPKLEKLGLFPDSGNGDDQEDGESSLFAFLSGDPFYTYVAFIPSLRHLTCTLAWFDIASLQILGQLPHLETITFCAHTEDDATDWSSVLPDDSFPSLRSLSLHRLYAFDIVNVLSTTQVTKNLTSLDVRLGISGLIDDPDVEHVSWLIEEFFPLLLNAPHLANLRVDAEPTNNVDNNFVIGGSVMEIFQKLPLKTLHLEDIYLNDAALDFDLASVWPLVTRLCIPQQPAPPAILSRFAAVPGLQYLELRLDLRKPMLGYNHSASPLAVLSAGPASGICWGFKDLDLTTRALLDVFPNLTRVAWPKPDEGISSKFTAAHVEFLNGHLATLREIRELRQAYEF